VLLQFHAGSSLRTDFGNWYVPTIAALHNLCRAAGFARIETVIGPPPPPDTKEPLSRQIGRKVVGSPPAPPSAPSQNYRAVVHAFA
jgi:hypothetical protein